MSRIHTFQDLQSRTLSELHALRGELLRTLAATQPYSAQARQTLESLGAVNRLIRLRSPGGPKP